MAKRTWHASKKMLHHLMMEIESVPRHLPGMYLSDEFRPISPIFLCLLFDCQKKKCHSWSSERLRKIKQMILQRISTDGYSEKHYELQVSCLIYTLGNINEIITILNSICWQLNLSDSVPETMKMSYLTRALRKVRLVDTKENVIDCDGFYQEIFFFRASLQPNHFHADDSNFIAFIQK